MPESESKVTGMTLLFIVSASLNCPSQHLGEAPLAPKAAKRLPTPFLTLLRKGHRA